jgi:VanZ family protein
VTPVQTRRLLASFGAVALMIGLFALSSQALPPAPVSIPGLDKIMHATVYGLLGWLLLMAMKRDQDRLLPRHLAGAVALASLYGMTDELHQYFVPGRDADPLDWCADTVGALVAVTLASAWTRRAITRGGTPPPR